MAKSNMFSGSESPVRVAIFSSKEERRRGLSEELKLLGFAPVVFGDGEDFLRRMALRGSEAPEGGEEVLPLLRLGVCGYVLESDGIDLRTLFYNITENGGYISPGATGKVLREIRAVPPEDLLTFREQQVLREICGGASGVATARFLSISENTLRWHLKNIYRKLGVKNRVQLLSRAQTLGFF